MTTRNAQRVEQLHAYIANTRARLETEQRRQQAERDRENQAARDRWQAKLAADREAEQQRAAAAFEASLAPTKEQLKREWLANHPDRTPADFDRHAWPQLRANLLADQRQATIERTKAALRRQYGGF